MLASKYSLFFSMVPDETSCFLSFFLLSLTLVAHQSGRGRVLGLERSNDAPL